MPLPPLYRQLHNIKHFSNLFCKFIIKRNMNHKIEYNGKEYKEHGFYPRRSNIEYVLSENQTASKISSSLARFYSLVIFFRESFEKDV